ncbi:MAG TPA: magnesium transporter CorA family protein [Mycobacteriales bacterium]|nr:magnesium transporter CorA family protein [Mycobacteriales bacterium]
MSSSHRTRAYCGGELLAENFPLAEISDRLGQPDAVIWLDLCEPDARDFAVVAKEFGLAPLAVEDAMTERQRPKVDHYSDHLFLSLYAVRLPDDGALLSSELAVFVSPHFLITVRKDGHFDMEPVVRAWDDAIDLASSGTAFLLWGLLDVLVDGHFTTVETLDERLDDLEDQLFGEHSGAARRAIQRRSFVLRKSVVLLRRLVTPMREVVNTLLRREQGIVDDRLAPYYQDVYDHVLRVTEWTDGLRDLVGNIVETNLTIQGNQLNEIMKKLTSYAAIVAVPTAITGYFGQNVHFPGIGGYGAFAVSLVLIFVLAGGLWWFLRRRGWL